MGDFVSKKLLVKLKITNFKFATHHTQTSSALKIRKQMIRGNLIVIFPLFIGINCFGQVVNDFDYHQKLKQELVDEYIHESNSTIKEATDSSIFGQYNNSIVGGVQSNLILYSDSIYKFEFIDQAYGYYDIGKFSYEGDTIRLTSLLTQPHLLDTSKSNYHNKIVDMTGVLFLIDEYSIYNKQTYYRLTSFGKTADELKIENDGRREWIKLKRTKLYKKH